MKKTNLKAVMLKLSLLTSCIGVVIGGIGFLMGGIDNLAIPEILMQLIH